MVPRFRAWDKTKNKMYYFDEVRINSEYNLLGFHYTEGEDYCDLDIDKNNFILMQSTGLKDKNGKEIFEGDIIKGNNSFPYGDKAMRIVWDDKRAGFFVKSNFVAYDSKNFYKLSGKTLEIIGNKFQNPELMKGEEHGHK